MYMYTARKLPGKHVDLLYPQSLKLFMYNAEPDPIIINH